jgi:hypothetical protein
MQIIRGILIVMAVLSIGFATVLTIIGFRSLGVDNGASITTLFFVAGIAFIQLSKLIKAE